MIEFASCEWYEKNKLVYLINELKSNEKTLAEALLYLLIVSLFPVCKDENELYKDNPITNKKDCFCRYEKFHVDETFFGIAGRTA